MKIVVEAPNAAVHATPRIGPAMRPLFQLIVASESAGIRSSAGTSCGVIACNAGPDIAAALPCTRITSASAEAATTPERINSPRPTVSTVCSASRSIAILRRSKRSASSPPSGEQSPCGRNNADMTMAVAAALCDVVATSVPTVTACIQVPMSDTTLAPKSRRRSR